MKPGKKAIIIWIVSVAVFLAPTFVSVSASGHDDVQTAMRDAVLHDVNQISLFGLKDVNPGLIAAMVVSAGLLIAAALIRIFVIPKFTVIPGRFQLKLEQLVGLLDGMAKCQSPGKCTFVGAYVFAAGIYIFVGTLFELLGLQAVATNGASITLPAPLSDINAAICMGCQSYLVILIGGISHAGLHGVKATLKEFSLPISMSFRLFGALLSGLLVTDLVYHYRSLSYGVPVIVGVMFTLLHALIQAYVLTMLVGMYYGEVSEKPEPKPKVKRPRKSWKEILRTMLYHKDDGDAALRPRGIAVVIWILVVLLLLELSLAAGSDGAQVEVGAAGGISPRLAVAMAISGVLLLAALVIRIFVIPKFTIVPGKFQMVLERIVGGDPEAKKAREEQYGKYK